MEIFEITGFSTGVSKEGVNFLQPSDSFEEIFNGFIKRQVLQTRRGFARFGINGLSDGTRCMGIFEHVLLDNSTQTLAISQKFLYKYTEGTNSWDQIANTGGAPAAGFNINAPEFYVSGTSYPNGDGGNRFVFCGQGLDNIYFYDGTDVKQWNLVADNPSFQDFANGALTKAWYVFRYGERINFFLPTVGGIDCPQAVLYSAIRSGTLAAFKGDKFNTAGSGLLAGDTEEYIQGVAHMGDTVVVNFSKSNWTLQKTSDAFNPYLFKRLTSVIGTDAPYSTVAWGNQVRSIGKDGIIATDLRETLRVDNKIPDFTADEIEPIEFHQTYGGFNRLNQQFLWSYKSGTTDNVAIQDRMLVNNYEENTWSIYDARFSVFGPSENGETIPWDDIDEITHPERPGWATWDTTEEIWNKIGILDETIKTLAGDNAGIIYILDQDGDDYTETITDVSVADPCVISVASHCFAIGDKITISGVVGVLKDDGSSDINNFDPANPNIDFSPYIVTAFNATTITIDNDTSTATAWESGGLISKIIEFSAKTVPFNPYRSQGRKVYISHVEFLIDTNAGPLHVDFYADEEETPFKGGILALTDSTIRRREWITISVNNESEFLSMRLKQKSPDLDLKITSIRIHASPGGLTSG